jgi:hypothetical protein
MGHISIPVTAKLRGSLARIGVYVNLGWVISVSQIAISSTID